MSSNYQIFRGNMGTFGGIKWIFFCGAVAAIIAAAHLSGYLTEACLAVIVFYAFWRGVLPYFLCAAELREEAGKCAAEHEDLTAATSDQSELLLAQDDTDAGSVHQLAKLLVLSEGRGTKEEASESFFESFDSYWNPKIEQMRDTANYCPTLGIAGTMLGLGKIATVLEQDGGTDGVAAAVATMAVTTLAGGACFVLVSGLARKAADAIAMHRKDLKYVAAMFQTGTDRPSPRRRGDNAFTKPGVKS